MNEYLNQIEISGITYDLVASGGTGSGVTPTEVQEMIEDYTYDKQTIDDKISSGGGESIQILSGDVITLSGDVKTVSGDVKTISGDVITLSGDVISLSGDVQIISGDIITLSAETNVLEGKIDTLSGEVMDNEQVVSAALNDLKANKLDASAYTPTDLSNYYKKSETSGKTEIQSALDGKQDKLTAGIGITIIDNVISSTGGSASGVTSGDVQNMLSAYTYDKDEIDDKLSEVSEDVITISGDVITLSGNVYSKSETSGKTELDTEFAKYYKKDETSSKTEIDDALNLKQDIMSGSTHIEIESGTVINLVIDNGLDSGSTHPVVNSAVTHAVIVQPTSGSVSEYAMDKFNYYKTFTYKQGVYSASFDGDMHDERAEFELKLTNHLGETAYYSMYRPYDLHDIHDDKLDLVFSGGSFTITTKEDWYITLLSFHVGYQDGYVIYKYGKYGYGQGEASEILHDQLIPDVGVLRELIDASGVDFSAHTADTSIHFTSGAVIDIVSGYSYSKAEVDDVLSGKADSVDVERKLQQKVNITDLDDTIAAAVSGFADSVLYNSSTNYIEFYNGSTKVYELDASPFLIDGMLEDVTVEDVPGSGTCMVFTFNADASSKTITIPLSDMFDTTLYYTKTESDAKYMTQNIFNNKFVCVSEAEWSQISGSTQSDTLYMIY